MDRIQLKTLALYRLQKDIVEHRELLQNLNKTSNRYLWTLEPRIECMQSEDIFQSQFFVCEDSNPIGYLETSPKKTIVKDYPDTVALSYAVLQEHRQGGYGTRMVGETLVYLAQKQVPSVTLCISPTNSYSLKVAHKLGFECVSRRNMLYVKKLNH